MSKLYHPDVAKGSKSHSMFTEITEAYEVLGNLRKRRMYDRGIYTRNNFHGTEDDTDYTAAYQQKARNSPFERGDRPPPPRGRTNVYNFDEFYRQHYNDIRERRANEYKEFIQHQQNMKGTGSGGGGDGFYYRRQNPQSLFLALISLLVLGTVAMSLENYDRDLIGSSRTGNSHPNYYGLQDPLRRIPVVLSDEKDQDSK
ncbi:DnaJ-like protein subfamily C member 30 [Elysia marginata]|uniref:DnaJ-like protein subfamily C member 30 n=1 Tax=Elysia marginata TaxID=1093978 RepID=A0AAV4FVM8_9GAST|nr:DnaJ-like protein subfamily C member 30 [Elysia marginata]